MKYQDYFSRMVSHFYSDKSVCPEYDDVIEKLMQV